MFASAKKVARAPAPAKTSSGAGRPTDLIPGWEDLCALDACAKALEGLIALKKATVTAAAIERLLARGLQRKGKPDTMKIEEGDAAGSAYIRRRDSRRPVTPDEAELIADLCGEGVDFDGLNTSPGFTEIVESAPLRPCSTPTGNSYWQAKARRLTRDISF